MNDPYGLNADRHPATRRRHDGWRVVARGFDGKAVALVENLASAALARREADRLFARQDVATVEGRQEGASRHA